MNRLNSEVRPSSPNRAITGTRPRRGLFKSIRTKLIVSLGLVFTIALAAIIFVDVMGVPFTHYRGRQGQERDKTFKSLSLVADLKKDRILRWLDERRSDVHLCSQNDTVRANAGLLRTAFDKFVTQGKKGDDLRISLQAEKSNQSLRKFMNLIKASHNIYERVLIADAASGTVLVSTDETDLGSNISAQQVFTGALTCACDYIADPELDLVRGISVLRVGHAIKNLCDASVHSAEEQAVAVLIKEIKVDEVIRPMLHTGEGLGVRGEALLVNQNARILTSLKHLLPNGSAAIPLEHQIQAQPAVLAARGLEGIIEAKDYRGVPVLAAYRHIRLGSDAGWGLIVKQDKAELFAPMRQQTIFAISVGAVGILAVLALTVVMANNLTRPILSLSRAAGQVAHGNLDARAEVISADEVGRLAATFNDMTENVQHRTDQLRHLASELTRAEQSERRRLAQLLHDHLQQLLVGAKMQIGILRDNASDKKLQASLNKTFELLGKSLEASRTLTVELSPPILYDAGLPEALKWLGQQMQDLHGLTVQVDIDARIKQDADSMDELLFRAVQELLFNIVKHSGVHNASVRMSQVYGESNWVRIVVRDAGRGFDVSQLMTSGNQIKGFGLFSIRERLDLFGGRLEIESTPGHGTCATLIAPLNGQASQTNILPTASASQSDLPTDVASPPASTSPSPGQKIRVLIADDHKIVREGLLRLLNGESDIEVVAEAEDGQMALELARRTRPDVAILDVSMPRLDGIEATRLILAELPGIRVIGLSMHEEQDIANRMREAGAVAYLTKGGPSHRVISAIRGKYTEGFYRKAARARTHD